MAHDEAPPPDHKTPTNDNAPADEDGDAAEPNDPLSQHLERGWAQFHDNDHEGARISAAAAQAEDAEAPEPLILLGALANAAGDDDGALALYEQAIAMDDEYVAPMLSAAEILLWGKQDSDAALAMIDDALDVADEEDDFLDAMLLKVEAQLAKGDHDDAAETMAEIPPVDFPSAELHIRAGALHFDLGNLDEAEAHYQKALVLEPDDADTYHGLGLIYEERGDERAMVKAFLKVRELDLAEPPAPDALTDAEFDAVAEAALAELPERIRKLLENIPIVAGDYPSIEIVTEGNDPRMMGFFSGVPYPEKSNLGGSPHLDCIFLYQRNIARHGGPREEITAEVRITLLHETGHFFGLSEEELEEMGLG